MTPLTNRIRIGRTRRGKTLAGARDLVEGAGSVAAVVLDPHNHSLAEAVLTHAPAETILFERLSDLTHTLGFDLLRPSTNADPLLRRAEDQRTAETFVEILLRRRGGDGLAGTPLMEEWVLAVLTLSLCQSAPKPVAWVPSALTPGTDEFRALLRDCTAPEVAHKFRQLDGLSPRALRAEVGSAARLLNGVFRSPAFVLRARGGFDLGAFLQKRGMLVVERGDEIGDDAMRAVMGAIVLLTIDHCKRRPKPFPPVRVVIDEATNARLVGPPELRGVAETNKNGLYWEFLVQNLDFPGGADPVLQNCAAHEWFGCAHYALAREGATDVVGGLPADERSRAERIAALADDITNLPAGWRWVRDEAGARREYVPLLEHPYPDWPGLRAAKLGEKLAWIHSRSEYGAGGTPPCSPSSPSSPPPPPSSPPPSSPAERWRRGSARPAGGSSSSGGGGGFG